MLKNYYKLLQITANRLFKTLPHSILYYSPGSYQLPPDHSPYLIDYGLKKKVLSTLKEIVLGVLTNLEKTVFI